MYSHALLCLAIVECPMRGGFPADEDAWLYNKWKTEVDVDSLLQATWCPGPFEDEVDTYEALVLAGRVSEFLNEAPSLFGQEDFLPRVGEPSAAGISEEEDTAIPVSVARKFTRHRSVDETKPLVVGWWKERNNVEHTHMRCTS